jgi:hypothetical protein
VFIACLPVGRVLDDATPSCGSSRYRSYCDLIEGLRSYYDYHESNNNHVIVWKLRLLVLTFYR